MPDPGTRGKGSGRHGDKPNLAHTFGVFRIGGDDNARFKLSPERCCFMLVDQRPKGWHVQVTQDPAGWWDDFMAAIHSALEPFAPKPN